MQTIISQHSIQSRLQISVLKIFFLVLKPNRPKLVQKLLWQIFSGNVINVTRFDILNNNLDIYLRMVMSVPDMCV